MFGFSEKKTFFSPDRMPSRKELIRACEARSLSTNGSIKQLQRRLDKSPTATEKTKKPNAFIEFQKKMRHHVLASGITEPSEVMSELARLYREDKEKQVKTFTNKLPDGYLTVPHKFTRTECKMNKIIFLSEGKNEIGEKQFLYCKE